MNMHTLHTVPHVRYGASWENLLTYQDIISLLTISSSLMTCIRDHIVIL